MIINEIKMLLLQRGMTLTSLADELGKRLNKKYTLNNLSSKLRKETIPYREIQIITEILDYQIVFRDKTKRP